MNNQSLIALIVVVVAGIFAIVMYQSSQESASESISDSVSEFTEEVGDEIDDATTN